jgi:hypothetical protein
MELDEAVALIDPARAAKGSDAPKIRVIKKVEMWDEILFMRAIMHKKTILSRVFPANIRPC